MNSPRTSGILLHPTSLPGPYGIGSFGKDAYDFVDLLAEMKQGLWQVLPMYPTGFGDSPYAPLSAFAGNPLMISPDILLQQGWLSRKSLKASPVFPDSKVDFSLVRKNSERLFRLAHKAFLADHQKIISDEFENFCRKNQDWLDDFSLFMALKKENRQRAWFQWPEAQRMKEKGEMQKATKRLNKEVAYYKFLQFMFFRQWHSLRKYANSKGIRIIGDNPIYEAYDSADVWAQPGLFQLDALHRPVEVAGVPPDGFSKTGQLWGNPLYNWPVHRKSHYEWWKKNLQASFDMTDYVRIDHFIGFVRYYAIPYDHVTAEYGRWRKGPGLPFFRELKKHFGELPLLAEDLGACTPEVHRIRAEMGFLGMKILHEAFNGNPDHAFLPHNYTPDYMVYTSSHDSETGLAAIEKMGKEQRAYLIKYLNVFTKSSSKELLWGMIALALSSVANMAVIPMQDLLGLGGKGRMNRPGTIGGNWEWRFGEHELSRKNTQRLKRLTEIYGRAMFPAKD